MDGYEVEIDALRVAANAANSAGAQAREVRSSSAVTEAPGAMPGSESSTAVTQWAAWFDHARIQAWVMAAIGHGERLNDSADLYTENDDEARSAFNRFSNSSAQPPEGSGR